MRRQGTSSLFSYQTDNLMFAVHRRSMDKIMFTIAIERQHWKEITTLLSYNGYLLYAWFSLCRQQHKRSWDGLPISARYQNNCSYWQERRNVGLLRKIIDHPSSELIRVQSSQIQWMPWLTEEYSTRSEFQSLKKTIWVHADWFE